MYESVGGGSQHLTQKKKITNMVICILMIDSVNSEYFLRNFQMDDQRCYEL